jgi:hypothetical protein
MSLHGALLPVPTDGSTVDLQTATATVASLGLVGGPLATASSPYSIVGGTRRNPQDLSGTLISAVYRTSGGTLDFFYQLEQNPKSPAVPFDNSATQDLFAPVVSGISSNGGYISSGSLTGSPFLTPTIISGFKAGTKTLTASQNTFSVDFHLNQLPLTNNPTRTTSAVFVLATGVNQYQDDFAQVSAGTISAQNIPTFSPTPEPGFYGALAVGLAALFASVTRAKKTTAVEASAVKNA